MSTVNCFEANDCPNYQEGCYTDKHHLYYPRAEYKTPLEKRFRSLGVNIVRLCRQDHDELHTTQTPPEKPSIEHMRSMIMDNM